MWPQQNSLKVSEILYPIKYNHYRLKTCPVPPTSQGQAERAQRLSSGSSRKNFSASVARDYALSGFSALKQASQRLAPTNFRLVVS